MGLKGEETDPSGKKNGDKGGEILGRLTTNVKASTCVPITTVNISAVTRLIQEKTFCICSPLLMRRKSCQILLYCMS